MNIPMNDVHTNMKVDLEGKLDDGLVNIKTDEVSVRGIHLTDRRQRGFALLRAAMENLQSRHGIGGLG